MGSSSPEHVEETASRSGRRQRALRSGWGNGDFVVLGVGLPMGPAPICEGRGSFTVRREGEGTYSPLRCSLGNLGACGAW